MPRDHARVPVADLTGGASALDMPAFEDPDATPRIIMAAEGGQRSAGEEGSEEDHLAWIGQEEDERHFVLRLMGGTIFVGGLLTAAYLLAVSL